MLRARCAGGRGEAQPARCARVRGRRRGLRRCACGDRRLGRHVPLAGIGRRGRRLGAAPRSARDRVRWATAIRRARTSRPPSAARRCASHCRVCLRTSSSTGRRRAPCSRAGCRRVRCAAPSASRAAARSCCSSSASTGARRRGRHALCGRAGFPPWLAELPSGRHPGIGRPCTVGALLGDTSGNGSIALEPYGISWQGTHYERVTLQQREVRVGAVAATLKLPRGGGPFPAAVVVHGSGPGEPRGVPDVRRVSGVAGRCGPGGRQRRIGRSTGPYPGERGSRRRRSPCSPVRRGADPLRRGAAADGPRARGLFGDSQAGWSFRSPPRASLWCAGRSRSSGRRSPWASRTRGARSPARVRGRPGGHACAQMLAQVRALGPSGVDPNSRAREARRPCVPGCTRRRRARGHVPTELCVESLQKLEGRSTRDSAAGGSACSRCRRGCLEPPRGRPGFGARALCGDRRVVARAASVQ